MGKDMRGKNKSSRTLKDTLAPNSVGSEPKVQRQPRNRKSQEQGQKDSSKNVDDSVRNVSDHTISSLPDSKPGPLNTAELFANLKRETDDIAALKSKKTHRHIFSNWARYEEPLPDPHQEAELQGADFEALLTTPTAGHFQFKSERAWDDNITSLSGELFSLDVDLLADGLATIPLYQKLDIPDSLFSAAELEDMDSYAKQCAVQYETTRSNLSRKHDMKGLDATVCPLLNILMKEGYSVSPDEHTADKNTATTLCFGIAEVVTESDITETETVNANIVADRSGTDTSTKKSSEINSKRDVGKKAEFSENGLSKVQLHATDFALKSHSICSEDIMLPAVIPKSEVVHISGAGNTEVTRPPVQKGDVEQTEDISEMLVLRAQKSDRHKCRDKTQPVQVQSMGSQNLQEMDDDLDFFLSLKKPVKETKMSSLKPSHVTESTTEDDDETVGPNSSQTAFMTPQNQTENLEDWLDSILDE